MSWLAVRPAIPADQHSASGGALLRDPPRRVQIPSSAWRSAPAGTGAPAPTAPSTRRIFWPSRRRWPNTASRRASRGRCLWGCDTHALSEPAWITALEVLVANGVRVCVQPGVFTPTPLISHAILGHNRAGRAAIGGRHRDHAQPQPSAGRRLQVQPPVGRPRRHRRDGCGAGPRQRHSRKWDARRETRVVGRGDGQASRNSISSRPTCDQLPEVWIWTPSDRAAFACGVDPLGGGQPAGVGSDSGAQYGLNLEIVNRSVDPRFAFMSVDRDGKIRMDCSSPYAMAGPAAPQGRFRRRGRQRPGR